MPRTVDDHASDTPRASRARRWLRRGAIAFGIVLVVVLLLAGWLVGTGSGLRFALARASGFTDHALTVQLATGRLIGPLQLDGVRYHDAKAGVDVHVQRVQVDLAASALLAARIHVHRLAVDGITVALTTPATPPPPKPSAPLSLTAPIDIALDRGTITALTVQQDGAEVFVADHIDVAGAWTKRGLDLKQLALAAPAGHAQANADVTLDPAPRGTGRADFSWNQGATTWAGTLQGRSDGKVAHLDANLTAPFVAHLTLALNQRGNFPWTANLDVRRFVVAAGAPAGAGEKVLNAKLEARGDRRHGSVTGALALNDHTVQLAPLDVAFSEDLGTLTVRQLAITSPDLKGNFTAHGEVQIKAEPLTAKLDLAWHDVVLPADLAGQELASGGTLNVAGSAKAYRAQADFTLGPPKQPARVTLDVDGTDEVVTLHALDITESPGSLKAQGELTLAPTLAWQLQATTDGFDPGRFVAALPGSVDVELASRGQRRGNQFDATLNLKRLAAKVASHSIDGHGQLHLAPSGVVDGTLQLASGASRIDIDAKPGARNDANVRFNLTGLGEWLTGAAGQVEGTARITGQWPKLAVTGDVSGHKLAFGDNKVGTLTLDAKLPDVTQPGGDLKLRAEAAALGGLAFTSVRLDAGGSAAKHHATLAFDGDQLAAQVALHGQLAGADWRGTLDILDLTPHNLPAWGLRAPAAVSRVKGALTLGELCLTAGEPELCARGTLAANGALDATWRLHALPVALATAFTNDLPMRVDGTLEGTGTLAQKSGGVLTGHASLTSANGILTWLEHPGKPALTWQDFSVNADLGVGGSRVQMQAGINADGRLDGDVTFAANNTLGGSVNLHLPDLSFAELFTDELAKVTGSLDAAATLDGTLTAPAVQGHVKLADFGAEVPAAGLTLSAGHVNATTTDARTLTLDGSVKSGQGTLQVGGSVGLAADAATRVTLAGDKFLAANLPAAKVTISPDLIISRAAGTTSLGGKLAIDSADIDLGKLPGAGAVQPSPDIVVVDRKAPPPSAADKLAADIRVDLGQQTKLKGFGVDARVSGQLRVQQRPGHEAVGQGQIIVDGTYRAYGQDLKIQRGRLLFASTPLDNPGLDIRATRSLRPNATIDEGQAVGLNITGTAQRPVMTVFSKPLMAQSDALSYLVTGKPLSQVKGGEGNMVGAAAQALGSAAGDLLAKGVGARLGVDAGVSSSEALGGGAAFTVGKYLSPKLYLSYGVGLFDPGTVITLRYILTPSWNFEAEQATEFSRASFNYRHER